MDLRLKVTNRQILSISLPISMALIIPQVNFITNNVFLGMLGETALATAGITGVYYIVVAVIGNGLNAGLQSLISRRAGENNVAAIGRTFAQGLRIGLGFSVLAIVVTYLILPWVLNNCIHSPEVRKLAYSFLLIRVFGLPLLYTYQMGNAFLVGTNHSRYLFIATLCDATVNIFLDYSLIGGHFGFPRMGFNGAAYSSIISEATGMTVVLSVIGIKGLYKRFYVFRQFGFDRGVSALVIKQSSPLIIQYLMSITAWLYFYTLIEHKGTLPLAISNTVRNIIGLFGVFTWAFASTTNTMVSNVIGQGKEDQVMYLLRKIMILSLTFSTCVAVLLNCIPQIFLSVYGQDKAFMAAAIPTLRTVTGALMLMSVGTVWISGVTGTGKTRVNMVIELGTIAVYCIYVYLVVEKYWLGLRWAWGSEYLYWFCIGGSAIVYIRSGRWRYA